MLDQFNLTTIESLNARKATVVVSNGKYPVFDISIERSPPEGILFSTVNVILADCNEERILFLLE